jgi:NAD(P)-dependent dehydrogenase (short-subunit alcohol dehydrogenase family)
MNAIVTGATKGIGRAIAEKLVREGLNVAICSRHQEDVERTVQERFLLAKQYCNNSVESIC